MVHSNGKSHAYAIFSIDTEHDIVSRFRTRNAGWEQGLPLLFEIFDKAGLRGKVCWLIEHNIREGIPAANPDSVFYTSRFPQLIEQINERHDGIGIHPGMTDWVGGNAPVDTHAYIDNSLWDNEKRFHDREFVLDVITSATDAVTRASGVAPSGCRTGGMWYATHLAEALARNHIYVDSSVIPPGGHVYTRVIPAYYASAEDIYKSSPDATPVLEIPANAYIQNVLPLTTLVKLRAWLWTRSARTVFLSFYIHNWQAVLPQGGPDRKFLAMLASFLEFLQGRGVRFLNWPEAYDCFKSGSLEKENILF